MSPLQNALLVVIIATVQSAFPPSLRYPLPVATNKITTANLTCDSSTINATLTFREPFKGLLFAKDFSHECNTIGTFSEGVTISLPTSGCGVRLSNVEDQMVLSVVVVAQQDRHLRQIIDQEKRLECVVHEDAFRIRNEAVLSQRTGRMQQEELAAARAWMEINPEERVSGSLQVGEMAMLSVKSTLPAGIDWKVVECLAHDGLGDSSQRLLDEDGCPIDEYLLPVPERGPIQPISSMKHQEATAKFAAFKFPDRDRLHVSCRLELCRVECQKVDCFARNTTRIGRTLEKGERGEVLDRLEVFNSVEVLAPAIDDLRKGDRLHQEPSSFYYTNLPGDRTFCVSPDKIAVTFCILGLIFLSAVLIAACALLKSRRNDGASGPFYTRSLFSSSSGGSAYGSKLLLHESPCLGQSTSRRMPYGRIL